MVLLTIKEKPLVRKRNWLVLIAAAGLCPVEIERFDTQKPLQHTQTDIFSDLWAYRNERLGQSRPEVHPIGECRHLSEDMMSEGVIGIYNQVNLAHLNNLVQDICEIIRIRGLRQR